MTRGALGVFGAAHKLLANAAVATGGFKAGLRVRHAQFGVGTIIAVEGGDADMKLIVRFGSVGQKKLMARFANLTPA